MMKAILFLFSLMLFSCSEDQPNAPETGQAKTSLAENRKNFAELRQGDASGTIKSGGETVQVRYAYARWVKDEFDPNENMIELLLTERAIPKEKLAFVFQDTQYKVAASYPWLPGVLRGMRFRIKKDGFQYGFGPTHLAFSLGGGNGFDEFKLEGDRVSGADEERNLGIDADRWSFSVSFVASLRK